MKISVIVTSYNHEKYISQAIDSILMQKTGYSIEIIIGDDCSSDKTPTIIDGYKNKHPNLITVLHDAKNLGVTKNVERCIRRCTGDYIAVCEGDDYWTDEYKLQSQVDFLENNLKCSMCFHKVKLLYEDRDEYVAQPNQDKLSGERTYNIKELIKEHFTGNFSSCMYRKTSVDRLGDEIFNFYTVDWMFNMAISEFGEMGFIDKEMSVYRICSGGAWSGLEEEKKLTSWVECIDIYNRYFDYRYNNEFLSLKRKIFSELLRRAVQKNERIKIIKYCIKIGLQELVKKIINRAKNTIIIKNINNAALTKTNRFFNELGDSVELKLHLGCGTRYIPDWINIDNNSDNNIFKIDINFDLSKGIPFSDSTVDYIYNEHFIEHLSYDDGLSFLKECFRVLKGDGVLRIACPDLDSIIEGYVKNNWRTQPWVEKYNYKWIPSRCYMVNVCLNQYPWGHKYVYNREDLINRICEANFKRINIVEETVNNSKYSCFRNIDSREDSMIFEIKK